MMPVPQLHYFGLPRQPAAAGTLILIKAVEQSTALHTRQSQDDDRSNANSYGAAQATICALPETLGSEMTEASGRWNPALTGFEDDLRNLFPNRDRRCPGRRGRG